MDLYAYHDSHNLFYRKPFGAVECGRKIGFRLKISAGIPIEACYLRLWKKGRERIIPMSLIPGEFQTMNLELRASKPEVIPPNSAMTAIVQAFEPQTAPPEYCLFGVEYEVPATPGLVWYYFVIQTGSRTFYYGNNGERLGGEGQLRQEDHPPSYQITVYQPAEVPAWYKQGIMYQIFVDRFKKGQQNGCFPYPRKNSLLHTDWNDTPIYIKDERGRVTHWDFFGGNLAGVLEELPYLKELGISIIYFNPIFDSPSNHKYDTSDYLKIDPAFGDEETLELLVARAKSLGISIILDGVFSHTGSDSIYFNKYGNYPGLGAYQSPDSPYFKWYKFKLSCDIYECWWDVDTLPEVEEMDPSYRQFIYGSEDSVIRKWMKKGIAGWRLDVADELPDEFIQELRQAVKEINPEAVLIGEVWEDASHKESYGQLRQYFLGNELDATMNYPWREVFLNFLLGQSDAGMLHRQILSLYENYPRENFYAAMNLIGSHDRPRILTLLGEAPPEGDLSDSRRQSFRLNSLARQLAVQRLRLLSLVQMTFPGVPCVYYGDEAGLEGYGDPYNRGTYPWGYEDRELQEWYKRMIRLRLEYEVLQTGDFQAFYRPADVYGYRRRGKNEEITVLINRHSTETREVTLDWELQPFPYVIDLLSGEVISWEERASLTLEIGPSSGRACFSKKVDPACWAPTLSRSCGVLMPVSSLPSDWGAGDFGEEAYRFLDFLAECQQSLWQILPLNPTGFGNSPYQSDSAFAGNPLFISLDHLLLEGLLKPEQVREKVREVSQENVPEEVLEQVPDNIVNFRSPLSFGLKYELLRAAFQVFQVRMKEEEPASPLPGKPETKYLSSQNYLSFIRANAEWLGDYALFRALKTHFGETAWYDWEQGIAARTEASIVRYSQLLAEEIEFNRFVQYTFFFEWQAIRQYALAKGIKLIGDIPLFVAADSCDVWANRRFFVLEESGKPAKVAGVPPDYFSATGQRWGNPLYNWEALASANYSWWKRRIHLTLRYYDYIRIDHFRGLEAFWEIEASEETAVKGRWMKGPGKRFLESLSAEFGKLPFIAEDLGFITPEVNILKRIFGLPGMKILQFTPLEEGLADKDNNFIYYSGTHDNDTLLGWLKAQKLQDEKNRRYAGSAGDKTAENENSDKMKEKDDKISEDAEMKIACRRLIEDLYMSPAAWVIIPMQDILGLDTDTRMNIPGTVGGNNWQWQMTQSRLTDEVKTWLRTLVVMSVRSPLRQKEKGVLKEEQQKYNEGYLDQMKYFELDQDF